jgi:predicted nucleic acid-binding Zn ribbon protein
MRYNKDFISLSSILKNVLNKYELNNLTVPGGLLSNWREMVGRELAEYFTPRYLREGILYLEVIKTAGSRELKSKKKILLQVLHSKPDNGPLKDVKFI